MKTIYIVMDKHAKAEDCILGIFSDLESAEIRLSEYSDSPPSMGNRYEIFKEQYLEYA